MNKTLIVSLLVAALVVVIIVALSGNCETAARLHNLTADIADIIEGCQP